MKYLRLILTLTLVFLIYNHTQAENIVPQKLSLAEAVDLALKINPNLKSSENSQRTSLSQLQIAGLGLTYGAGGLLNMEDTPDSSGLSNSVYGSLSYKNLLGTEAELDLSPFGYGSERGSIGFSLKHPLMKGKGRLSEKSNLVLDAQSNVAIQNKSLFLSRQSTVQDVISAYYRTVLAQEEIKVQEEAVRIAEELADGTRKREAEGLVLGIEVSRAEIRVAQTRNQLNLRRASARSAMDRLMLAIGSGVGQTPELADKVPEADIEIPPLEEAIETALRNRSELTVFDERIAGQTRKLQTANDNLRPQLDMVARYNSTSADRGFVTGSILDYGSMNVGLQLTFPLDKRINTEERKISEIELKTTEDLRIYRKEQISQEVRDAYRSIDASKTTLDILGQNLKVAESNLQMAQRMVDEDLASNREILEAQEALTEVQMGINSAKVDLYLAGIDLKYALGEDLTTMGSK